MVDDAQSRRKRNLTHEWSHESAHESAHDITHLFLLLSALQ